MSPASLVVTVLIVVAAAVLLFAVPRLLRYRGERAVKCPENHAWAGVHVAALHPHLRLNACSRWPEKQDCGQECLGQIEAAPAGCLVTNLLSRWYAGKECVRCHTRFGEIRWSEYRPSLLSPEGKIIEWSAVKAEALPSIFSTYHPVCWKCGTVAGVVQHHPELVVDRKRPA